VDKSVDNFAISVDNSTKPVDNFLGSKKLSTGKPTYPHFIHRLIHRQNACIVLINKYKKKVIHRKCPTQQQQSFIFK
jgi:hypothetical protein